MSLMSDILESLVEQARKADAIRDKLYAAQEEVMAHAFKCYIWRDTEMLNYLKKDLRGKLHGTQSSKINKGKFLDTKDIYSCLWRENGINVLNSAIDEVLDEVKSTPKNQRHSVPELTPAVMKDIQQFVSEYLLWLSEELHKKGTVHLSEVKSKVDELLAKHPIPKG